MIWTKSSLKFLKVSSKFLGHPIRMSNDPRNLGIWYSTTTSAEVLPVARQWSINLEAFRADAVLWSSFDQLPCITCGRVCYPAICCNSSWDHSCNNFWFLFSGKGPSCMCPIQKINNQIAFATTVTLHFLTYLGCSYLIALGCVFTDSASLHIDPWSRFQVQTVGDPRLVDGTNGGQGPHILQKGLFSWFISWISRDLFHRWGLLVQV